jgi:hypothetical protein
LASVWHQRGTFRRLTCFHPVGFSPPLLFVPVRADLEIFSRKKHLCSLQLRPKTIKPLMNIGVSPSERKPVATVTVGLVAISIYAAPITVRTAKPATANASSAASIPES